MHQRAVRLQVSCEVLEQRRNRLERRRGQRPEPWAGESVSEIVGEVYVGAKSSSPSCTNDYPVMSNFSEIREDKCTRLRIHDLGLVRDVETRLREA